MDLKDKGGRTALMLAQNMFMRDKRTSGVELVKSYTSLLSRAFVYLS
jgi:hypothetical protein